MISASLISAVYIPPWLKVRGRLVPLVRGSARQRGTSRPHSDFMGTSRPRPACGATFVVNIDCDCRVWTD